MKIAKRDDYESFLEQKRLTAPMAGIHQPKPCDKRLFPFQRDIVRWALKKGKAAIWADCGLGKTLMALEWARHVCDWTAEVNPGTRPAVLVLTPLAVAQQFKTEGEKFGIPVTVCREGADVRPGINVTNYERLAKFDVGAFAGIVADESSILKDYTSATRNALIEAFAATPFRLACTATPAPNDHMELGNHAEFLGVMTRAEMLAMFFVHDGGRTTDWRIKGHAQREFWRWVCTWAVSIRTPSDLGYDDTGFILPPLNVHQHVVSMPTEFARKQGNLFVTEAKGLSEQREARRSSLVDRVKLAAGIMLSDKLAACGSRNISRIERDASPPILNTPQGSDNMEARERQRKTASTCEPIILPTRSDGQSEPKSKRISETQQEDSATVQILNSEISTRPPSRHGSKKTRANDLPSESENMVLPLNSMTPSPRSSVVGAPSAGAGHVSTLTTELESSEVCISTTATKPDASGDCSAPDATSPSGSSEMTTEFSNGRRHTFANQWMAWVDLNDEQDALASALGSDCVSIYGSLPVEEKIARWERWLRGEVAVLVTKPSIFGFGVNAQHCARVMFVGISHSFEAWYQAIRRTYRFGQSRPVECHVVISDAEGAVLANLRRKQSDAESMTKKMIAECAEFIRADLTGTKRDFTEYKPTKKMTIPAWVGMDAP